MVITWTPKVCRIIVFLAVMKAFKAILVHILIAFMAIIMGV